MRRNNYLLAALWTVFVLLLALTGCGKGKQSLEVTGVFPANGAGQVPSDCAIELTFSAPPEKLDGYFSIEPAVEGRFQYMKEKVAFLPSGRYEGETAYTVTVKAGLPQKDGKAKLMEDVVFTFTAQAEETLLYRMVNAWETFLPEDYPVLDLGRRGFWSEEDAPDDGSFSVEVYRLSSGEQYRDELYKAASYGEEPRVDTTGMTPVMSFTNTVAELIADVEDSSRAKAKHYMDIIFPEPLPEGWYVASVTPSWNGHPPFQKLLQIQPSAVYTQKSLNDLLLWYNSTSTGMPMANAALAVYEDPFSSDARTLSQQAGADGVVTLDISALGDGENWAAKGQYSAPFLCYGLTSADGQVYYDVLSSYLWGYAQSPEQAYYGFLYTDRPIYHSSDTAKFWGVVRPRKDAPAVKAVRVDLLHNWGEPMMTQELPVSQDGVFTGEFAFENLAMGDLGLRVYLTGDDLSDDWKERWVCGEDMEIAQYKKPVYTASISSDKLYYRPGEEIRTQVEVSLFDRTPAAGMDMRLWSGFNGEQRPFTTGDDGLIETVFPAALEDAGSVQSWYPQALTIYAQNDAASDVDLTVREEVYIFPTSIMLEAEETHDKESSTLTITANNIDFSRIPGGRQIIQDYETLRGTPAQVDVQVSIQKATSIREELPPYYDRYSKKSIPRVAWRTEYETVDTSTQTTGADGKLVIKDLPLSEEYVWYYAEITLSQGGATQRRTVSLGTRCTLNPDDRTGHMHTFQIDNSTTRDNTKWYSYYEVNYRFGETSRYRVMDNGVPAEGGTVMLNQTQNKVIGTPWVGEVSGDITSGEELLPDYYLCGAYFDGKRIYPIYPCKMQVEPESRSLNLSILPGQEDYRPGDTASVTVALTDENGRPVTGGSVCLGVVDEAVFAVREQYLDMGHDLYNGVFYSFPDVFSSYVQHGVDIWYGEGGKGGGGGGGGLTIRENFQDTAAFLTGKTGADGTTSFRVTMPDDLTQWRLTAVALDSRAYWGQSKSQLYTTLPFRIDPILSTTFLSGDTIACTVRGFGTGITTEDEIAYTATIEGYEEPLEVTASAPAGKTVPLVFRRLPAGDYTVTVTAQCGDYSDGVRKSFSVRDSALTFPIHRSITLGEEDFSGIQPTSWPVEMTIYPEGQKSFMTAWGLIQRDDSLRADHRLAMAATRSVVSDFFGSGYTHPEADITDVQISWMDDPENVDDTGGLRLFPYAGTDVRLTARAALVMPELVNSGEMAMYLYEFWQDATDPTDIAAALMGAAALKDFWDDAQPQQLTLKARNGGSTILEDLYLITGVSYLDNAAAQKYYAERIAPLYKEERGGLYLASNTPYDTVEQTAAALACAILTGAEEDADRLLAYLSANALTNYGTMRGPCQLEAALYLLRSQPAQGQPVTVSYTQKGRQQTRTLDPSGCLRLTVTREDWNTLGLTAQGAAIADVDYTGDPEQMGFTSSRRVIVTKTMDTPEEEKHLGGETTVTIKVELDPAMPYGQYRLVEWVPSNMRLREVSRLDGIARNGYYYGYRADEQLLTVDFYRNKDSGNTFILRYTATSVLDTECTLERCYAYCAETMEGGRSEKGDFLPSDYYYLGAGYLFRKQ